jgi:hypothetical protein
LSQKAGDQQLILEKIKTMLDSNSLYTFITAAIEEIFF